MPGIGKTAFVLRSVSSSLGKQSRVIRLTRGHSLDLLARQIIQKWHATQPATNLSDQELLSLAIDALRHRGSRFFLLLDNAESALNADNTLLPFLKTFLEEFCKSEINTHIILTTTRIPDYGPSIGSFSDVLQLTGLANRYIKEAIDLLLIGHERHDQLTSSEILDEVVKLASGHPLAAKMLASFMKVRPIDSLMSVAEKKRFELRLAQYILQSAEHSFLSELHKRFLHVLATVREPMLMEDVLTAGVLSNYSLEDVQSARLDLTNWFFVEQDGELMYLHNFLIGFFTEEMFEISGRRDEIASDVGLHLFEKAKKLAKDLGDAFFEQFKPPDSEDTQKLSNELLRYAVPAARLLRSIGEDTLANQLPIQVKGTLREMVFFFYQEKRDWNKTLHFAENWLQLNPHDIEIQLYRIRCYRNFRNVESTKRAEQLLAELGSHEYGQYFKSKVFREKAIVAREKGDIQAAKDYFRSGIDLNTLYPENYVGLAELAIKDAERVGIPEAERKKSAKEALVLLKKARSNESALFDRIHLGLYVEALIQVGDYDTAFPLLQDALAERPHDARLNYHMAEIMRDRRLYDDAERFGRIANKYGHQKAPLSLANTLFEKAQYFLGQGQNTLANEKLREVLRVLEGFQAQYGTDHEVVAGIKAKTHRLMGSFDEARKALDNFKNSNNTYTISEFCKTDIEEAKYLIDHETKSDALAVLDAAEQRIQRFGLKRKIPQVLEDLRKEIERLRISVQAK